MLTVGLTGGIGSGKSCAAEHFQKLGVPIIDADIIARKIVGPGQHALDEIIAAFGGQIIGVDGSLDRTTLRKIIFTDKNRRIELENILHPRIHDEILRQIENLAAPYCIAVIPLLAESGRHYPLDRILVIDLPEARQIERTVTRDQQSAEEIDRIIQSQATRKLRLKLADDIIDNSGTPEALIRQVDALHLKYMELAENSHKSA